MAKHYSREDIERDYKIVNGTILNPGKFEGQPIFAPYFYELANDGDGEVLLDESGDVICVLFTLNEEDWREFPELRHHYSVKLQESDLGFVYCRGKGELDEALAAHFHSSFIAVSIEILRIKDNVEERFWKRNWIIGANDEEMIPLIARCFENIAEIIEVKNTLLPGYIDSFIRDGLHSRARFLELNDERGLTVKTKSGQFELILTTIHHNWSIDEDMNHLQAARAAKELDNI